MATAENLEGALVTLQRVGIPEIKEIHERFQERELYIEAGLYNPPTEQSILEDLEDEELWLWEMTPERHNEAVGYVGIVAYSGPTYVFAYFFDQKATDLDLAQDAMVLVIKGYFENTKEDHLWTYLSKPIDEEIHDRLIEGGFDFWDEDVPGIDREKTACYIMERHTFKAYYDDGEDDEEVGEL